MKILRLKSVMATTGMAKSTIYKAMKDGGFPKSFKLGARSCGWLETDILEWINSKTSKGAIDE